MSTYKNKTAIISGGAEGIGFSIAQALGAEGMNIVLTDISESNLKQAEQRLQEANVPVLAVAMDVAQEQQWQAVATQAIERFGKIHMLVNNAGVGGDVGPIENIDSAGWQWTIDVNLMGVVYGAKTLVPLMKQHGEGGWVINVASMAGMGGMLHGSSYAATKNAVVALSESWYQELKSQDIHVAVLCPAFVQTRIHESHRNRQDCYKNQQKPSASDKAANSAAAAAAKKAVEGGIEVEIVGKRVVEALNHGELYIFTHPNYRPVTQHRAKAIDDAFERATKSPLLQHIIGQRIENFA